MADMPNLRDILNGTAADATDVEWNFNTVETHIDNELIRVDGANPMEANLPMGSNRITGLGSGVAGADAVNVTQLVAADPTLIYQGSGTQAFTAGQTADVTIDTEVFDIGSVGAVGSAAFEIPTAGLYLFHVAFSAPSSFQTRFTVTTGANVLPAQGFLGTGSFNSQGATIAYMNLSDVVTFSATESAGVSETLTFSVRVIRLFEG